MNYNSFSSEVTEELLTQLAQAKALRTIQEIDLCVTANFDADASAEACANILANALQLRKVDIQGQQGERKIRVEVKYATAERPEDLTEDTMGTVTVK